MKFIPPNVYAKALFQNQAKANLNIELAVEMTIRELFELGKNVSSSPISNSQIISQEAEAESCIKSISDLFSQKAGAIDLVLAGEDHSNEKDKERAIKIIKSIPAVRQVNVVIVELQIEKDF